MTFDPFTPAYALADQMIQRVLSPVEVMEVYLDRIARHNPGLNALVTLHADRAMEEARLAEQRLARGEVLGRLAGLPFAVKDLEDVAGMVTTHGSPLYRDHRAVADSVNVERMRAAGAIPVGKTNTPEFGAYMQTSNAVFGVTRNPWNLDRTPGGSSGGSAAALVAGLVPLVTASDGGGSIRIPAAFSGCVGLKPTFRRIPQRPDPILVFDDTAVWGPLTLTVRDAARLADCTFGPHEGDPTAVPAPAESYEATLDRPPGKLRIGYCPSFGTRIQPDIAREVDASVQVLAALGHDVEVYREPIPFAGKAWSIVSITSVYLRQHRALDEEPEKLDPMMRRGMERVRSRGADDLAYAYRRRTELGYWTEAVFGKYDLLALPTLPLEAFPVEQTHPAEIDGESVRTHDAFPFTYPFNLTGHPAISLPAGMTDAGLPAGLQLVAPRFREDRLLGVGRQFEEARPWRKTPPAYLG
jgi:Asp-tRNA(Asn)/Glu-tRNA(Gln) amidotransferase A subunit family amidase